MKAIRILLVSVVAATLFLTCAACGNTGEPKPSATPSATITAPTEEPSAEPTEEPTGQPTAPTETPTVEPTTAPPSEDGKEMTGVEMKNRLSMGYDGTAKTLTVTGAPEGAEVAFSYKDEKGNALEEAVVPGTYEVTAVISAEGYRSLTLVGKMIIVDGKLDSLIGIEVGEPVYDGTAKEITVSGYPEGAEVSVSYSGDKVTQHGECVRAGEYKAQILIVAKYYRDYRKTVSFTVKKAATEITVSPDQEYLCTGYYPELRVSLNHNEATEAPLGNAYRPGTYHGKITVAETENYASATAEVDYTIVSNGITESVYEGEGRVNPIEANSSANADKIVYEGFALPDDAKKEASAFRLPQILANNMLLQAKMPVRIWGKTQTSGSLVAVQIYHLGTLGGSTTYLPADGDYFEGYIPAQSYGTDYTLRIVTEEGKYTEITGVAFGELFLASGQSNMGWSMSQCLTPSGEQLYAQEIANSKNDEIRLASIMPLATDAPRAWDDDGAPRLSWSKAEGGSVSGYSAAAYFFIREMYDLYRIPCGIVTGCMGGTGISVWTPEKENEEMISAGYTKRYTGDDRFLKGSAFFNGTLYQTLRMTFRGVMWYQGEGDYDHYAERLAALVTGWRREFENEDLKFVTVGMPRMASGEDAYARCREEHKRACTLVEGLCYSSSVDTGLTTAQMYPEDSLNTGGGGNYGIHPYEKEPVGTRSADAFAKNFFAAEGTLTSPTVKSVTKRGRDVIIECENVGSGLTLNGAAGFQILNSKGRWIDVRPEVVDGKYIVLFGNNAELPKEVDEVKQIRYGWINASAFISGDITKYSQCVSVYNTAKGARAYPLDSFWIKESE